MRTLMTIFLAMICISLGFVANVQAQSIIISVDGINPEADTLNFGARTENNSKVDSIIVVNNTSDTLIIPKDAAFLNIIQVSTGDQTFAEFELDTIQKRNKPFIILPQSRFPIKINFKVDTADKGVEFDADRSMKRALVLINLCKINDTTLKSIIVSDTLHLIGDRTARFMKPSDSVIVFDTMYIGTTKRDTLIVYNGTSSKTLDVNITTKNIANVKINPLDIGTKTILPDSAYRIPIEYTVNSLADSLIRDVLTITSSPGGKSQEETSSIDLKTFVAFQKFEIDSILTMNFDPTYGRKLKISNDNRIEVIDTIAIDSASETFSISLRNNGNIQLNIDSIAFSGDTNGFQFDFTTLDRSLNPTRPTSFVFSFKPVVQSGQWSANIALYTDLRKRFPNLPSLNSVEVVRLFIRGNAKAGSPKLTQLGDSCDTIYVSKKSQVLACDRSCIRNFLLKNNGTVDLIVNSILIANGTREFDTDNNKKIIEPGNTTIINVLLKPGSQAKTFIDTLVITTNAGKIIEPLSFTSISTEAKIATDNVFEANPGDTVIIPFYVESKHLTKGQNFSTDIVIPCKYRSSVEFLGFDFESTAAQKYIPESIITYTSGASGNDQNISIIPKNFTDSFLVNPVLAKMKFKYYLSEHTSTEIDIRKFLIGIVNNDAQLTVCPDYFDVTFPSKIIIKAKENSFCADQETLNSLFNDIRNLKVGFAAMIPVSGSVLEIQHFMPEPMHADISLYAVTGEKVETIFSGIAPKDLTKFQHPLSHLTKGVYYCEMKTGTFRKTVPIIISQ